MMPVSASVFNWSSVLNFWFVNSNTHRAQTGSARVPKADEELYRAFLDALNGASAGGFTPILELLAELNEIQNIAQDRKHARQAHKAKLTRWRGRLRQCPLGWEPKPPARKVRAADAPPGCCTKSRRAPHRRQRKQQQQQQQREQQREQQQQRR